jgi:hypothetical protein
MNIYMLQNTDTGLYYRRRGGWVPREQAAVWTSKAGPSAAKGSHWGAAGENVVTRTFKIEDDG